jgi:hypothetical protein
MTDRFELEQGILQMWNTKDDIELVVEQLLERDMSKDDMANMLIGLAKLHHMRSEKTFAIFEKMVQERKC